jgi:hypothetical protein
MKIKALHTDNVPRPRSFEIQQEFREISRVVMEIAGMKNRKLAAPPSPKLDDVPMGMVAPRLNPEIQTKIGQQLCKIYDEMVNQGIPDRFRDLLDRLDQPGKNHRESQ